MQGVFGGARADGIVVIGWAVLAIYVVVFFMTWRRAAWVLSDKDDGGWSDEDLIDTVFTLFFAGIAALVWPLTMPVWFLARGFKSFARAPRGERRAAEIRELKAKAKQTETHIAELERELHLSDADIRRSLPRSGSS